MFFGSCPSSPKFLKNNWGSITFFLQFQIEFFSLKGTTLFYLPLKFQKLAHDFEALRAYMNSQKTHFGILVV
jgi:hypothetical protein